MFPLITQKTVLAPSQVGAIDIMTTVTVEKLRDPMPEMIFPITHEMKKLLELRGAPKIGLTHL
jgi:hypothetical protein